MDDNFIRETTVKILDAAPESCDAICASLSALVLQYEGTLNEYKKKKKKHPSGFIAFDKQNYGQHHVRHRSMAKKRYFILQ